MSKKTQEELQVWKIDFTDYKKEEEKKSKLAVNEWWWTWWW